MKLPLSVSNCLHRDLGGKGGHTHWASEEECLDVLNYSSLYILCAPLCGIDVCQNLLQYTYSVRRGKKKKG